jgi:hypothetical protein
MKRAKWDMIGGKATSVETMSSEGSELWCTTHYNLGYHNDTIFYFSICT